MVNRILPSSYPMPIDIFKTFFELFERSGRPPGAKGITGAPLVKAVPLSDVKGKTKGSTTISRALSCSVMAREHAGYGAE